MKAQAETRVIPVPFDSVVLELHLTSQAEVDVMHNLFNCTQVLDAMAAHLGISRWEHPFGSSIRTALAEAQGMKPFKERRYNEFYNHLRDAFYAQFERQASVDKIAGVLAQNGVAPPPGYRSPDPFRGRPE